jgi:thioredoxin 1
MASEQLRPSSPSAATPAKLPKKSKTWLYLLATVLAGSCLVCGGLVVAGFTLRPLVLAPWAPTPLPTYTWVPVPTLPAGEAPANAPTGPAVNLAAPYTVQANASHDIAAALASAEAQHKYVLLDFGANWCPDCLVLAKLFEDATVKPFLDQHFVVARINVGQWDTNLDIAARYDNPIAKGIPAIVVLDAQGKIVATTKAGELADARSATAAQILAYLQKWAPQTP